MNILLCLDAINNKMKGFFNLKETQSETRPEGKLYSCTTCGLYENCISPKIEPYGGFKKGIMNIGSMPSSDDDTVGTLFQGRTGRLLKRTYSKLGIDLIEDCININAVRCCPKDKAPTTKQITSCRRFVLQYIKEYQPKIIVIFGDEALQSIMGHRWKNDLGGISKWRGWIIPDQDFKAWVCPTLNPEYVQQQSKTEIDSIWAKDLAKAVDALSIPFYKDKHPTIHIIDDLQDAFNTRPYSNLISFDYETTGIKPHMKGHRIVCAAVAVSPDECYSFKMPDTKSDREPFLKWLRDPTIGKMAHNMKFEDHWTVQRLRTEIKNWTWDSMQAAHILDNRPYITGLKFQTYVNFGIIDYASEVVPYLKSTSDAHGANGINQIQTMFQSLNLTEKLLTYCGMDAIYQYRLAMKQIEQMNYSFLPF